MSNPQSDPNLEAVVNALLKQIKQQPVKTEVPVPSWIEHRFGIPKTGEEVLWRFSWLFVVPGILTLVLLPAFDWLFFNGFPWIVLLFVGGLSVAYGLTYWLTVQAAPKLQSLLDVQFGIPLCVIFFVVVWEFLS